MYAIGGWTASGSASVGFIGAALLMCFARGPWETRWLGWRGGWSVRRRDLEKKTDEAAVEMQSHQAVPDENGKDRIERSQP